MQLYIKKNPNPQTLIDKVYSATPPDGYELATEQAVSDWVHSQIVAGWEPTFPDLPIEEQKLIVEQQRNTYREQSLFLRNQVTNLTSEKANFAAALAEVQSNLATKTSQLEAVTQAKTALDLRVATLTNETQALTSQVSMLEAVVEAERQKVIELEQYRPYNPRWLDGEAFYNRVSKEDMVTLLTSDNPQLVTVGKTIELYRKNHVEWPVILDSTDFQNLVGYVLQSGVFDADEVTAIMRDATKEEAYRVPE